MQTDIVCANGWSNQFSISSLSKNRFLEYLHQRLRKYCRIALHPFRRLLHKSLGCEPAMAASLKIRRCFERINQLLSLLVPVNDINRAAAGRVAAHCAVACAVACAKTLPGGEIIPNLPKSQNARAAKYKQNEWFKQRFCELCGN